MNRARDTGGECLVDRIGSGVEPMAVRAGLTSSHTPAVDTGVAAGVVQ